MVSPRGLVRLVFLRGLYFYMLSFTGPRGVDSKWPYEKRRQLELEASFKHDSWGELTANDRMKKDVISS